MSEAIAEVDVADRPSADALERMYRLMVLTMKADAKASGEAKAGRLAAAFYPVRGMEAVCAAIGEALAPRDQIVSTYRNLGDALAKGTPLRSIMAELYGRVDGTSRGKGGPMHLHDTSVGFMATTGVVGSGLPIAVGLGLAAQLDGDDRVVAVTFGDGATSIGSAHEAFNLAALWRLPVVFICQNNQWGEHTPLAEYAASTDLASRVAGYGMRALKVDGFDAIATWRTLRAAIEHARSGAGPVFVECLTYRLTGHTGTADFGYVPKDELAAAMERDPAPTFRRWLGGEGLVPHARLDELEAEAEAAVEDAFAFAAGCPAPGPEELLTDVFADDEWVRTLA